MDTKKLKQKILDLAIRGKLVPQYPNDEPASVLLEQIHQNKERLIKEKKIKRDKNESLIYRSGKSYYEKRGSEVRCIDDEIPFEIPESWSWCRVLSISKSVLYGVSESAKLQGTLKLLRITDIQGNSVNWQTVPYTAFDKSKAKKYLLKNGDIVFARTGATVGKSFLIDNIENDSIYASYLIRIEVFEQILSKYIKYYFESGYYWEQIATNAIGIGQPNVNGTVLGNLYIPIPSLPEQQRIVESIEQAFALIDRIEADKSDLSKVIRLTKAKVLDLAIRGKLVPQDPNDEPASVLLERIKGEKQTSAKGTKKQQKQPATTSDNSHYPFDIPSNWIWCKFGDVSDYGKCLNAQPEQIDSDDWVLDLEDIEKDTGRILAYITHKERKSASSKHIFKKGQLLYSKLRPYLNKVVVAEFDGFCTSEIIPIDFKGYIVPKYGQVYLMSPFFLEYASILSYGVKMPRMGTDDGKKANIPLPPFTEQQRIVVYVSNVFKQLDNIEELLKA